MLKANTADDIDFLPEGYQRQHGGQGSFTGSVVVTVLCISLLLIATVLQLGIRWKLASQLEEVTRQHKAAIEQTKTLARLREEKRNLDLQAELLTYLRKPWPRSVVLVQIAEAVPESTVLTSLEFRRVTTAAHRTTSRQASADASTDPQETTNGFAADLATLRAYLDGGPTVVTVEGLTQDVEKLHAQFLRRLNEARAFERAELHSVDRQPQSDPPVSRFNIELALHQRNAQINASVHQDQAPPSSQTTSFSTKHVGRKVARSIRPESDKP